MSYKIIDSSMNFSGIYMILNLNNNKFYIGSSINIWKRKIHHLHHLKNNKHGNSHLQKAFNKYGEKYFTFIFIEKVEDIEMLEVIEQKWIDELSACVNGYNINPTSKCRRGYKWSKESKQKMSQSHIGIKHSDEAKQKISDYRKIPILQLDLQDNLIKEWDCMQDAEKFGFCKQHISHCCKQQRKTHKGFRWVYKNLLK